MKAKKAFTLIELLVVIAIIAILAAILFPVFAQAKEAAKKTQCLSNTKQLALGVVMYQNDSDDTYPPGTGAWMCFPPLSCGSEYWGDFDWGYDIAAYLKSNGVTGCPDDTEGGTVVKGSEWEGVRMSYSTNGLTDGGSCKGVMCIEFSGQSLVVGTTVHQPASVIMLAENHSDQMDAAGIGPNFSHYWPGILTGWPWYLANRQLPNGCGETSTSGSTTCDKFPLGVNGAVSTHGGNTSNFAFCDGHVKAMVPTKTVPDNANPTNGAPWWLYGEYSTGNVTGKPASMWEADHD